MKRTKNINRFDEFKKTYESNEEDVQAQDVQAQGEIETATDNEITTEEELKKFMHIDDNNDED